VVEIEAALKIAEAHRCRKVLLADTAKIYATLSHEKREL
jgi:hypothetical protein